MQLTERVYKQCPTCKHNESLLREETFGCDQCKTRIDLNKPGQEYLQAIVFYSDNTKQTDHLQFCSWKCCLKKLRTIKTDHFISLPYLLYDTKKIHAKEFFRLMK